MTNLATLKADVAQYLARDDLAADMPTFVRLAESRIRRDVRVRDMEAANDAFTVDSQTKALPTGFIAMRRIIIDSTTARTLTYLPPERFWDARVSHESGTPEVFTIEGGNIHFAPVPGSAVTAKMTYFKSYDALVNENDTNWLIANAYDIYLYAVLAEAKAFIEDDEQAAKWQNQYETAVARENKAANQGRRATPLQRFGYSAP